MLSVSDRSDGSRGSLQLMNWFSMKPQTKELLEKLKNTEFFKAVGQTLPEILQSTVIKVSSWKKALKYCSSIEWDNYTLEQTNNLTMYLGTHAHDRYQNWNDLVREVKKIAEPLIQEKIS